MKSFRLGMRIYVAIAGVALLVIGLAGIAFHFGVSPAAGGGWLGLWIFIATIGGALFFVGLIVLLQAILRELRSVRSYLMGPPLDFEEISTPAGPVLYLTLRASKRWWLRIDLPTAAPGKQKRHAHVYVKNEVILVVDEDGTGSHGTVAGTRIPDWAADLLRSKRFKIQDDNRVRIGLATPATFVEDLEDILMRRMVGTYSEYERILMVIGDDDLPPIDIRDLSSRATVG